MIQIVYDKILDFSGLADVPCVVVGSKCDLQHRCAAVFLPRLFARLTRSCSRQVQASEGEKLAQRIGAAWIETSAKDNINVGKYCVSKPVILPILYWTLGKVFELCLGEFERRTIPNQAEPQANRCVVM